MSRPPGPIRKYTVYCVWPSNPGHWRTAVDMVDERTARESALTLRRMHYELMVEVILLRPTAARNLIARFTAGQWDRYGKLVYRYQGDHVEHVAGWSIGTEPMEREKADDGTVRSDSGGAAGVAP
jgi:hypothetical protein